ncbi:MAG: fasciclin domain-containing protein [Pseudomonadota bacterium]
MEPETQTIAEIAAGSSDFSILVTALDAAGLVDAVADPDASLTVFAPTNEAFAQLAADLGYTGDPTDEDAVFAAIADALAGLDPNGDPIPLLTDVLLYHVSPGAQSAEAIATASSVDTLLEGATLTPDGARLIDLEPDLLDGAIVVPDIAASNGTIQAIDRVLLPLDIPGNDAPSIADIATGNADFEVLVLALEAAGLTSVLADVDADFTVFAPTDAAFAALAADLGFTGDADDPNAVFGAIADALTGLSADGDPIPLLTDILLYHVAPGAKSVEELIAAPSVLTASGLVVIPSESGILDADPEATDAAFIDGLTDIPASNGTVQAIDRVLLPLDLDSPEPQQTLAEIVAASGTGFDDNGGDFDMLLAALQAANLVDAVANPDADLTVFAPTDSAFISLARSLGSEATTEEAAFNDIVAVLSSLDENGDPIPLLTEILLYHVIDGSFTRVDLAGGPALTSLATVTAGEGPVTDGDSLADLDPDLADPLFVDAASDIVASNGIVQAIDAVLLPIDVDETIGSGGPDNDTITVNPSTTAIDGGAGTDTAVFEAALADAEFGFIDGGFTVTVGGQSVDLTQVETLVFSDAEVVADTGEVSASVFRLFGASFGRDPDVEGASFWTGVAESAGLEEVADAFIASDEFATLFGPEPTHSEYVEALYGNVLGRAPDDDGLAFWTGVLAEDGFDPSDLLLFFSESAEYVDATASDTDDGVLIFA